MLVSLHILDTIITNIEINLSSKLVLEVLIE